MSPPEFNPADNPFDRMSKYTARMRPEEFVRWVLRRRDNRKRFGGWLPEQVIPFPGSKNRICDCAAHVTDELKHGLPWAMVFEFKTEPDPNAIFQVTVYQAYLQETVFPEEGQKGRYVTSGIVINLSGVQQPYPEMVYEDIEDLGSLKSPKIINLSTFSAADTLREIEAGEWDLCILPWVVLMQGADDADIIERWKQLAATERKDTFRSDYATVAGVFAQAAGRWEIWDKALEGWNVTESLTANKFINLGRTEGIEQGELIGRIRTYQELLGETPDPRSVLATKSPGELEQLLAQIKSRFATKA